MALLWIEGFEGFGTADNNNPQPSGVLGRKYPYVYEPNSCYLVPGRIAGHALEFRTWPYIQTPALTTNATLVIGFGWNTASLGDRRVLTLQDGSTDGVNIQMTSGGELAVYRGGSLLGQTTGFGLLTNTWYWIELKVVCGAVGSFDLRVGGTIVLSNPGINTKAGSHDYHDVVVIGAPMYLTARFDDIYILDGSGVVNNNFLGNVKVLGILPSADVGGYTDFAPSSGTDHYALVDENPINDDSDYVESSTSGHKDLWDYTNLPGVGAIKGLQINSEVRETDANSFSLKTLIKSDTIESADAGQAIASASYRTLRRISEVDPATTAVWLLSAVNAARFGVEVS